MAGKRQMVDLLTRRVGPRLTARIGGAYYSARGIPCRVRYDDGAWIHRHPTGTLVNTFLTPLTPDRQDREAEDFFLHAYRPQPGDTVLDVGAGIGGEVRLFSRLVGEHGRVVAIEAHPRTFDCLRRTVALNRLTNVTPVECAIVDTPGTVHLENDDDQGHVVNGLTTDASAGVPVRGRTLAEVMSAYDLRRVDLLKMNIEGAELPALRGSVEALSAVRHLAVSCHDFLADQPGREWQRTFKGVVELLRGAGFTIRTRPVDGRPWVPYYVYASRTPQVGLRS
ncbi:FkbM family methyltransferase [Micromonospora siamensis]|uniref:Methyltransferase, FkbM family n=1 Tax=Micromonospora siamensis TaxID=299152 RepID=A0A1C5I009_9ACTN|nr:FkbM family methyltransferase [Micromonospora siamensis]SCG51565.1 methyltransferase, FkbM family [Micromonospora siamensis]